jgi:AcrR family transcriptional regulator
MVREYSLTMTDARAVQDPTRERLLNVATRLFADRGFAGTNIATIQEGAGLTGGSGALYKHFPSKVSLFRACVERGLGANVAHLTAPADPPSPDQGWLRATAWSGLDRLAEQRDLLRVLFRDGENFPDIRDAFRDQAAQPYYTAFTDLLHALTNGIESEPEDLRAVAAVLLGAIVHYEMFSTLFDEPPGRVPSDQFVDAWAEVVLAVVRGLRQGLVR